MGSIRYDGIVTHFDDRVLTHVQIIVIQKFSRGESFLMSWKESPTVGDGRMAIWLSPTLPITFKFSGGKVPTINRDWLMRLGQSADSSTGLVITGEDGEIVNGDATGDAYPGRVQV